MLCTLQDPLPCNELGVLAFRGRAYDAAEAWLQRALERVPGRLSPGRRNPLNTLSCLQCSPRKGTLLVCCSCFSCMRSLML
jgi:hypothetical protein